MAEALSICSLKDCPQYLDQLVRWHHNEWQMLSPSASLEKRKQKLRQHLEAYPIPQTFVATLTAPDTVTSQTLVGSASLVRYRFSRSAESPPWLTNVYVAEEFRGRGFGGQLVDWVENFAADKGFADLYLFTRDRKDFYLSRGWSLERRARLSGYDVDIMRRCLATRLA